MATNMTMNGVEGGSRNRTYWVAIGLLAFVLVVVGVNLFRGSTPDAQASGAAVQRATVAPVGEGKEVATLAGGCFWCVEAVFDELKGVEEVTSGYSGGQTANPTYGEVTSGTTGHAEVIQIMYDPKVISFKDLLKVFFTVHNPTTLNRQGADEGTQYRSAIFYHSPEQKVIAEQTIADVNARKVYDNPIVTEVTEFKAFYPAEEYHQEYFARNPNEGYCSYVISPKVAKFRKEFIGMLKK